MSTPPPSPSDPKVRQQPRRRLLTVLIVALAVVGVIMTGIAVAAQRPAPAPANQFEAGPDPAGTSSSSTPSGSPSASASASSHPSSSSKHTAKAAPTVAALGESSPTSITIPSIGVHTSFETLGLLSDGQMQTPANPNRVGWFTGAHTPGAAGVAVVAGHVTWNGSESAFFKLGKLQPGAKVSIHRQDGHTAVFAVDRLATFPKTKFPADEVYGYSTKPELVLITCGGDYSSTRHYYDSNVIAFAHIVSTSTS